MHALIVLATLLSSFVQHPPRLEPGERTQVGFDLPYADRDRLAAALVVVLGPPDATAWGREMMWKRGATAICYAEHDTRTLAHAHLVVAPDCWNH
jgi:hypothetical protein